ncbi:MAG: polysaccharide deacetylase family protein [Bacillota bacterium]
MVIYLRPATRIRIAAVLSLVLIVLGVRAGLSVQGSSLETAAKIRPITRVETSLLEVGLIVDVTSGGPDEVMACLAVLDDLGVKATWFLTATLVEAGEALVKEVTSRGHEIGIKGTDERRLDKLPPGGDAGQDPKGEAGAHENSRPDGPFLLPSRRTV